MSFVLYITAAGMGVVFGILGLLWGLLSLLTRFDSVEVETLEIDPEVAAAVTIAVLMHRTARRRQAAPEMRSTWPGTQLFASRWLAAGRTQQTRGRQGRR